MIHKFSITRALIRASLGTDLFFGMLLSWNRPTYNWWHNQDCFFLHATWSAHCAKGALAYPCLSGTQADDDSIYTCFHDHSSKKQDYNKAHSGSGSFYLECREETTYFPGRARCTAKRKFKGQCCVILPQMGNWISGN